MPDDKQWYGNKELFEQILSMKDDFRELQKDMQETRTIIKKYNGLYAKLAEVKATVDEMQATQKGRTSVGVGIRNWGGWIVAVGTFIFMLIRFFYGG